MCRVGRFVEMDFDGAPGVSRWDQNCLIWLRVKVESRSDERTKKGSDCFMIDIVQPHHALGAQSLSGLDCAGIRILA